MSPSSFRFASQRREGAALVLTLAAIVLLSIIVVSFLNRATEKRKIAFSSAGMARAEWAADAGMKTILGDLREEMRAGSRLNNDPSGTEYTQEGVRILVPSSNRNAVPFRPGPVIHPNVVKVSRGGQLLWSTNIFHESVPAPIRSFVGNSTSTESVNRRSIPPEAWLLPELMGNTLPASWVDPDWVVLTRSGAVNLNASHPEHTPAEISELSDQEAGNPMTAIGRFAFVIYDVGGLLDINVAGNALDTQSNWRKSRLHQAALGYLPLANDSIGSAANVNAANDLIAWRSPSASTDSTYLFDPATSFREVKPGDRMFVSRMDLVNAARDLPFVRSQALQYLTVFSRELNAPSYTPNPGRPKVVSANSAYPGNPSRGNVGAGNPNTFNADDTINPSLVNTRDSTGQPAMKQRFPLSRLAWITPDGPAAGRADDIKTYFGLVWDSSEEGWIYTSPDQTTEAAQINRLGEIPAVRLADSGPDFFELLQACIKAGSLGRDAGPYGIEFNPSYEPGPASDIQIYDQNTEFQILQVGANLIDQYDTDSFPTQIAFNGHYFWGIENLPYLNRLFLWKTFYADSTTVFPKTYHAGFWFVPEIWNPHLNMPVTGLPMADAPANFRFRASSRWLPPGARNEAIPVQINGVPASPNPNPDLRNSEYIQFPRATAVTATERPRRLRQSNSTSPFPQNTPAINELFGDFGTGPLNADLIGLWVGRGVWADIPPANDQGGRFVSVTPVFPGFTSFVLEYEKRPGVFLPYSQTKYIRSKTDGGVASGPYYYQKADPRTDRFGLSLQIWNHWGDSWYGPDQPLRRDPNYSTGRNSRNHFPWPTPNSAFSYFYGNTPQQVFDRYYPAGFVENIRGGVSWYRDPDGVVRGGEGFHAAGNAISQARMVLPGQEYTQPMILNRPFRNVGDMGYAFRDLPWRNLDFFGGMDIGDPQFPSQAVPMSGDAALLDAFCIDEEPVIAGTVNLNSRQPLVLASLLAATSKWDRLAEEQPASMTSAPRHVLSAAPTDSDAMNIAQRLVALTSDDSNAAAGAPPRGPLLNKAELATRLQRELQNADFTNGGDSFWATVDRVTKFRRETAVRALSATGSTRTWNLMVDIIAQSGRFPPNASTADDFVVEGVKRYWWHLAVDRYTGEIVDELLEPVYD